MPSNNINKLTCPPSISQNHTQTKTIYDTIFLIIYAIFGAELSFLLSFGPDTLENGLKEQWLGTGEKKDIVKEKRNVDATE